MMASVLETCATARAASASAATARDCAFSRAERSAAMSAWAASMGIILSPKRKRSAALLTQIQSLINHAAVNQLLPAYRFIEPFNTRLLVAYTLPAHRV